MPINGFLKNTKKFVPSNTTTQQETTISPTASTIQMRTFAPVQRSVQSFTSTRSFVNPTIMKKSCKSCGSQ